MNNEQRSMQIWSILVMAATNRQILTYEIIKALTGLHLPAIGRALYPIQYYCESKTLPRLTVLVVRKNTGMPGDGLTIGPEEILSEIQKVYARDWFKVRAPKELELRAACSKKRL